MLLVVITCTTRNQSLQKLRWRVGCSIPIRKRWNAPIVDDLITTPNQTTTSTKDNFHDDDDGIQSHKRHSQVLYRMQQTNNLALDGRHSSTSHLPKTPTIRSQKPILVENSQRIRDHQNSLQQLPQGHPDKTDLTSPPPPTPPRDFPAASLRPTPTTPAPKPSSLSLSQNTRLRVLHPHTHTQSQNTRFRVLHTHTHSLSLSLSQDTRFRVLHTHTSLSLSLSLFSVVHQTLTLIFLQTALCSLNPLFVLHGYKCRWITSWCSWDNFGAKYGKYFAFWAPFFGLKLLIKNR